MGDIFIEIRKIGFLWVIPYALMVTLSNMARSERWKMVLDDETGTKSKRLPLFTGIMYGYTGNLVLPRAGEFIRAVYVAKKTGIETTKLFGTVVLERVIDLAMMLIMLLVTFLLIITDSAVLNQIFGEEGASYIFAITSQTGLILVGLGFIAALMALFYLKHMRKMTVELPTVAASEGNVSGNGSNQASSGSGNGANGIGNGVDQTSSGSGNGANGVGQANKLRELLKNFIRGLISLRKLKNWPLFVFYTVFIWFCYVAMTLIPFYAFSLDTLYGFGWAHAFVITVVGAIGVALPSPGGIGTYHYLVQKGMLVLYQVPGVIGLSYAAIGHFMNMLVILATSLILYVYTTFFVKKDPKQNIPFSQLFR